MRTRIAIATFYQRFLNAYAVQSGTRIRRVAPWHGFRSGAGNGAHLPQMWIFGGFRCIRMRGTRQKFADGVKETRSPAPESRDTAPA